LLRWQKAAGAIHATAPALRVDAILDGSLDVRLPTLIGELTDVLAADNLEARAHGLTPKLDRWCRTLVSR
jgi:hypothetical protein